MLTYKPVPAQPNRGQNSEPPPDKEIHRVEVLASSYTQLLPLAQLNQVITYFDSEFKLSLLSHTGSERSSHPGLNLAFETPNHKLSLLASKSEKFGPGVATAVSVNIASVLRGGCTPASHVHVHSNGPTSACHGLAISTLSLANSGCLVAETEHPGWKITEGEGGCKLDGDMMSLLL
jgi:hypothetical protein